MHHRFLNIKKLLEKKSFFLLGPRTTGKSTLIQSALSKTQVIDLLQILTFSQLLRDPGRLEELILPESKIVVIDEVQRLPVLLNEVHRLIQQKRITFLLTGSSARKLKHGGANLLARRAVVLIFNIGVPQRNSKSILF